MKRKGNILLTLIIFVIPFITNINIVGAKILKYGDINEDNIMNQADELIVNQFIQNTMTPTPIQKALTDLNNDGNIDNTDKDMLNIMISYNQFGSVEKYQKGDVNMNGIIDPMDRALITHRVNNKITLDNIQEQLADIDGNGLILTNDTSPIQMKLRYSNLLSKKIMMDSNDYQGTTPDFKITSEDKGLFAQVGDTTKTENGFPVYYYRGNVENNYVSFAGILFRIVSINDDGSIKLITENSIKPTIWNSKKISKYINDDGSNSEIKTELESWYNENIGNNKKYDIKVLENSFCNDISGIDFNSEETTYSNAKSRIDRKQPSLRCSKGAIIDNNKVGLLTVDEIMYAGGNMFDVSETYNPTYLNNNTSFWTMSAEVKNMEYAYVKDHIEDIPVNLDSFYIRPVITLKANVEVTGSGDGSKDNPYVIDTTTEETTIMNTVNEEENIITTDVLNDTKENQKTIIYETYNTSSDNGNFKYSWTINPESITEVKDINTAITTKDSISTTDGEIYNRMKYALKNNQVRYVTLKQTGDLGLTSTIKLNVSDKYNNDSNVWVYRWDDTKRRYEEVSNSTVENGQVSFNVTKGDNYIISESNLSSIIENPPTGMIMFVVIGIIGLLLIGGITYLIYSKKNNRFLKV